MADTYLEYQSAPGIRPPWHGGPDGIAWWEAMGLVKDGFVESAIFALRQRWLSTCEESALARHGESRGWPRVAGETVEQYRRRLLGWWSLAQKMGTAAGIIEAFSYLGMTNVEVKESFTASWGRSGGATAKQRFFWVIVRQPHPFGTDFSFRWGDGTLWGDGHVYGFSGDPSLLEAIRFIVQRMRPAHAHCPEIIVVLNGGIKEGTGATDGDPLDAASRIGYLVP